MIRPQRKAAQMHPETVTAATTLHAQRRLLPRAGEAPPWFPPSEKGQ